VLRRIFEPKREEVMGCWRRLHNEELHNLYASPNIRVMKSVRMRWTGHIAHGRHEKCIQNFGQPGRKKPLNRPRCRWEDNIIMDLREIACKGVD